MVRRKFFVSLLLSSTILSSQALPPQNMQEIIGECAKSRSFPASRHLRSAENWTGSGILHYANGCVLLARYKDETVYCNLGTVNDVNGIGRNLAEVAANAVKTQSRYFAHHPYNVKNLPFIDTITGNSSNPFFNRVWLKKVRQISEKTLNNGSYDFKWIPIKEILSAILEDRTEVSLLDRKVQLSGVFLSTFKTPAGVQILKSIEKMDFSEEVKPFLNRTYDLRDVSLSPAAGAGVEMGASSGTVFL